LPPEADRILLRLKDYPNLANPARTEALIARPRTTILRAINQILQPNQIKPMGGGLKYYEQRHKLAIELIGKGEETG